jgi:hypothetical protein
MIWNTFDQNEESTRWRPIENRFVISPLHLFIQKVMACIPFTGWVMVLLDVLRTCLLIAASSGSRMNRKAKVLLDVLRTLLFIAASSGGQARKSIRLGLLMSFGHSY